MEARQRRLLEESSCWCNSLLWSISMVIQQHLPTLKKALSELPDNRARKSYKIEELVFAAIMLYVLKNETRHGLNQKRKTGKFKKNYERCFKMRLPHMDTVTDVLEELPVEFLEKISLQLVKQLLKKRLFHRFKLLGKYFLIAIDATGYASYTKAPNWPCPHKTSKNGKTWWTQPILCAKLVFPNGLCLPLFTEWIINEIEYDKQDCETKAFKRLAPRIKTAFPRLAICIVADGLYTTGPFFDICKQQHWAFMVVFKDTQLQTVWAQVQCQQEQQEVEKYEDQETLSEKIIQYKSFKWTSGLVYQTHILNWVEGKIEDQEIVKGNPPCFNKHRFVSLTNLPVEKETVEQIIQAGRLRWKIENEGFNTQKNGGYKLKHKMSRTNFLAVQNFMTCLQIGHLINQLIACSDYFKQHLKQGFTLKHCWFSINAFLQYGQVENPPMSNFAFRYT